MIEVRGAAEGLSEAQLLVLYEWMLTGRILDTLLLEAGPSGRGGFRHPCSGQEAAQVGFAFALDAGDVFAGGHRDLLATLVRGVSLEEVLADLLGRAGGPGGGRRPFGAPVPARGILGVSGATAEGAALATGAALAFRCRGERRVALACCGEGAAATGIWHEAVNAAAVLGLPVVFAVENNQYARSMPNDAVGRVAYAAHRADGYGIPGIVVDGNDVLEVFAAAREAVERARAGEGPSLVEAVTFRREGHDVDDAAAYVDPDVRRSWLARDPLPCYEEFLGSRGLLDEARREHLGQKVRARVERALDWVRAQPGPAASAEARTAPAVAAMPAAPGVPALSLGEALSRALDEEMSRDDSVVVLGPDAARLGGAHGIGRGLRERYGPQRVVDFPAAGAGLAGAAVGAARLGLRPVAELPARDLPAAVGVLAGHASGESSLPLVLRVPYGPGEAGGAAAAAFLTGLAVVVPSDAGSGGGLLAGAVRADAPVIFLEPAGSYPAAAAPADSVDAAPAPARPADSGRAVTVAAWGSGVAAALAAAREAAESGVPVEVVALQALVPLDWEPVAASLERTGRLVVVEDAGLGGVAERVAARAAAEAFWHLDGPVPLVKPPVLVSWDPAVPAGPRPAEVLAAVLALAET